MCGGTGRGVVGPTAVNNSHTHPTISARNWLCWNIQFQVTMFIVCNYGFPNSYSMLVCVCVQHSSINGVTLWRSWLRHCATSRKVAGSIPDGVVWVFRWCNSSSRIMALGLTQAHNRNEYQEYFLRGKCGRCVGLTTLQHSCAGCHEIWEPQHPGNLWACPVLLQGLLHLAYSPTKRLFYLQLPCHSSDWPGRIKT